MGIAQPVNALKIKILKQEFLSLFKISSSQIKTAKLQNTFSTTEQTNDF